MHAFAARFPASLPRLFIDGLTDVGDKVLDPMCGSGTVLLEAGSLGREAVGVDIDPLAVHQTAVKTSPPDLPVEEAGTGVLANARRLMSRPGRLRNRLNRRFDPQTKRFIDYWFLPETQLELLALTLAIAEVKSVHVRRRLELALSSVIVTKSGGVSRAIDLAHGRPHRVESKVPRNPIDQFERSLRSRFSKSTQPQQSKAMTEVLMGSATDLPIASRSIDLVVTSPPYANAIDYMRAHKFALVWLGWPIGVLSRRRGHYIGAERQASAGLAALPDRVEATIEELSALDHRRARVLRRYFSEMASALREMYRVLKPGRPAVLVAGSSTMRGLDVQTPACLAELAESAGFSRVGVRRRSLDRNRRMMPASWKPDTASMIQRRLHEEFVIGLWKP